MYGHLYIYLYEQMTTFCQRCRSQPVKFVLTSTDVRAVCELIPESRFDRIDVSNIMDAGYLDVEMTLASIKSVLNLTNTHSTVVSLFMNAIGIVEERRKPQIMTALINKVLRYLPTEKLTLNRYDPVYLRQNAAVDIFLPFDDWFAEYGKSFKLYDAARHVSFRAKISNTIVKEWPWRFEPG